MKKTFVRSAIRAAAAASAFVALAAHGASTGNTALHTIQGSGAGTASGDYISDNAGLNTAYHYFVEVTPGLPRLVIDMFDPDLGLGGTGEATAGRDRQRGGTWNTTATYSLFDPSGVSRTPQFTSGTNALPAGSDNGWFTFYDFNLANRYQDDFTTNAYTNNNGNLNFTTNWTETNDDNNATAGVILVTGGVLRIRDNGGAASMIEREADLSTFASANLSFTFNTANVSANDQMAIELSTNGGGTYTTLETFTGAFATTTRTYALTAAQCTNNVRVRFREVANYTGTDSFNVDTISITGTTVAPGHWEVRVDESPSAGDDINGLGLRAHDGDSTSGGTELNVYADSAISLGVNPPAAGTNNRSYTLYPYITSGCLFGHNDFDFDSDAATGQSVVYSNGPNTFSQTINNAALSVDDSFNRDNITGWTTDTDSIDDGIWKLVATIDSYVNGNGQNGNYTVIFDTKSNAAANPITANPVPNSFRIYLPTDAGTAPAEPYVQQFLRFSGFGSNPPAVGATTTYNVTIRVTNPTAYSITFDATHLVTANVPGGTVTYGQNASVSQGSVVSQPALGGTGNVTWNPGTVAAGADAVLTYYVNFRPTAAGQRSPVTGTVASGNGTTAVFLDTTGNSAQARAFYTFGPLCELAATQGLLTEALISSFDAEVHGGKTAVEWTTASEAGTIGFVLKRRTAGGEYVALHSGILGANAGSPRGGVYRYVDSGNSDPNVSYMLEEVTATGRGITYGPFKPSGKSVEEPRNNADFERQPRPRNDDVAIGGPRRLATGSEAINLTPADDAAKKGKVVAAMAGVRQTAVVRVTAQQLAATLGSPVQSLQAAIKNGSISVSTGGAQVAWTPAPDNSAIYFFGEKPDSIYSNDRVYRIEAVKGTAMKAVPVNGAAPTTSTFFGVKVAEVDSFPASVLPLDPESDYWFWDFIISGDATDGSKSLNIDAPAMASDSNAVLQVRLQGAVATVNSHHAKITLNGVPVGDVQWSGLQSKMVNLFLPAAALHSGANQVGVTGVLDNGVAFDVFYIDGFTLRYLRNATLDSGRLEMTVNPNSAVTVGAFAGVPMVLDIANRQKPVLLQGGSLSGGNLSFVAPQGVTSLFVTDSSALVAPSFLRASYEPTLKSTSNRADYVVIAPSSLAAQADALAQLRTRDGLTTYVADLNQIYDEFSNGAQNPHAIQSFIAYTARWSKAPKYFALAGSGNIDYRGIADDPGLVPPLMAKTSNGLFAADSLFGDSNGDGVPEVAIGRIPVATAAELGAYVTKLDTVSSRSAATSKVVYSADAADQGASFTNASQQVEAPLSSRPSQEVFIDALGAAGARNALLSAWNAGTPLVSWLGHGGLDRLSSSSILTTTDAPSLTSGGPLPVLVAMTCTINRFEIDPTQSLGAVLTRAPNSGAVAVWSASGLSSTADAGQIERTFMQLAAKNPTARIGDLIVQSLAANRQAGETASVYLLLGDPAIKLALPNEPAGTPHARAGRE